MGKIIECGDHAATFDRAYPDQSIRLRHDLAGDQRFTFEALLGLARLLPASSIEYNAGNLPIDQDPAETPMNGLSAEETIARIRDCGSWMVLKNVEQDQRYRAAMDDCLESISSLVEPATGPMAMRQAYVFISSPGAVTPFHMDPEHNILLQLVGAKTMTVYPVDVSRSMPGPLHEAYHAGEGHRNLRHDPDFEASATPVELGPGDAVYVPVKAPHRVEVGAEASISFSITWRSRVSDAESRLHLANRALRRMGFLPRAPGVAPLADRAKRLGYKAAERLGLT